MSELDDTIKRVALMAKIAEEGVLKSELMVLDRKDVVTLLLAADRADRSEVQLAAVTAERDAAVSALRLAIGTEPGRGTGVWVPLDKWTAMHTERERYGADQWRRGNAGGESQDFAEWQREQAADRCAAFNGGEI